MNVYQSHRRGVARDRTVDAGRCRAASCRTSEHLAVSAVAAAKASRRVAAHLHMRTMSTTCRPSTLLQHRQRGRLHTTRGSRSRRAAEWLANLCRNSPSIHGVAEHSAERRKHCSLATSARTASSCQADQARAGVRAWRVQNRGSCDAVPSQRELAAEHGRSRRRLVGR